MLEEVLNTPTSPSCFDLSLPRHRSRTPNTRGITYTHLHTETKTVTHFCVSSGIGKKKSVTFTGLFCRLLYTKIEVVKEIVQHATDNTQPMSMLSNELQTS